VPLPTADLRLIFTGSPEFAVPSLRALARTGRVVMVLTQPDRPAGRGRLLAAPPIARAARELGLPLLQPAGLRRPGVIETLRPLLPDLLVTVAYGRIIPPDLLALPRLGAINAHPSLLPAYRGASPIQRAIADGQGETGVTILYQTEDLDAGDIILQERVRIGPEETAGELERRLADLSARLLVDAVGLIAAGRAPRRPQDHAAASYVGKLTKEDGRIDWRRPAEEIANLVRAMDPWPSAYTLRGGRLLKVWRARALVEGQGKAAKPGTVVFVSESQSPLRGEIQVATGRGVLQVLEVQPEGGRRMNAPEFARGYRVRPGERWGGGDSRDSATLLAGGGS